MKFTLGSVEVLIVVNGVLATSADEITLLTFVKAVLELLVEALDLIV